MIWFVLWVCLAIYAVAGFVILIAAGLRRAWGLLPDSPEVVARQMRMRHDRELVRLERCLGWHQPTPAYPAPGIKRFVDELSVSFRRNCVPVSNQWHKRQTAVTPNSAIEPIGLPRLNSPPWCS